MVYSTGLAYVRLWVQGPCSAKTQEGRKEGKYKSSSCSSFLYNYEALVTPYLPVLGDGLRRWHRWHTYIAENRSAVKTSHC